MYTIVYVVYKLFLSYSNYIIIIEKYKFFIVILSTAKKKNEEVINSFLYTIHSQNKSYLH